MARDFHIVAVGQFVLVDRTAPAAPADGFVFDVREPRPLEWYFSAGTDPIRTRAARPLVHVGASRRVRPDPESDALVRSAAGDARRSADCSQRGPRDRRRGARRALQAQLLTQIDSREATKYTDGTLLLGEFYTPGVAPVLDVYLPGGGAGAGRRPAVRHPGHRRARARRVARRGRQPSKGHGHAPGDSAPPLEGRVHLRQPHGDPPSTGARALRRLLHRRGRQQPAEAGRWIAGSPPDHATLRPLAQAALSRQPDSPSVRRAWPRLPPPRHAARRTRASRRSSRPTSRPSVARSRSSASTRTAR